MHSTWSKGDPEVPRGMGTVEQVGEATRKLIDFNSEGKYLETSETYLSALDDEIIRLEDTSPEEISFFDRCRRPKLEGRTSEPIKLIKTRSQSSPLYIPFFLSFLNHSWHLSSFHLYFIWFYFEFPIRRLPVPFLAYIRTSWCNLIHCFVIY